VHSAVLEFDSKSNKVKQRNLKRVNIVSLDAEMVHAIQNQFKSRFESAKISAKNSKMSVEHYDEMMGSFSGPSRHAVNKLVVNGPTLETKAEVYNDPHELLDE